MSEYQYLEFLAIDKPLTAKEMSTLRALSSRADITPVSFINHYNWSSFQGDPDKLMEQHFDAYVYVANWLSAIFKIRLPREALEKDMADVMTTPGFVDVSDAYSLCADPKQFERELGEFMAHNMGRKAFIKRLVKAGIWPET